MKLPELGHPWEDTLSSYVGAVAGREAAAPAGGRHTYLRLIDQLVRCFGPDQRADGAVVDRYTHGERYYSTPSFALGAAVLVANGADDLLPSAERAMVWSAESLSSGAAADGHADFYTVLLVTADRLLATVASEDVRQRWRAALARIEPRRIYRYHDETFKHPHNWNLINLTGEHLRHSSGLGGVPSWWEDHLPHHVARFAEHGLYRDGEPGGTAHPLAYDAVSRYNLSVLLDDGYDGAHAELLRRSLLRGALTSLLIQSPTGDWPAAGRSSQHAWNEASLAAAYEWAAGQLRDDAPELAGACKRGARLAVGALVPWQRPDGDLHIVRNRCEPEERHGFEFYSNHTNYNLWTAAALSFAYLLADESIVERPLPSEVSAYTVDLGEDFHQAVAVNAGLQIVVDTLGDPSVNPTGLVRVNRAGCNAQVGPADGAVASPRYAVLGATGALAHAPAWRDRQGEWHSLAEFGDNAEHFRMAREVVGGADDEAVTLDVTWRVAAEGCRTAHASYRVHADRVRIRYDIEGVTTGVRAEIPLFASDGADDATIEAHDDTVTVRFADTTQRIRLLTPGATLRLTPDRVANRTGWLRRAYAEAAAGPIELMVEIEQVVDSPQ